MSIPLQEVKQSKYDALPRAKRIVLSKKDMFDWDWDPHMVNRKKRSWKNYRRTQYHVQN